MQIRESAEMYLETILVLSQKGDVRSIDIARAMDFSRPSVSVTVHNLEKEHYIKINENGTISLEPAGREIAERIYERHMLLAELFMGLGVSPEKAQEDACKVEHDISEETFDAIRRHARDYRSV